ncbi:MAG: GGDEF domain-containing protein [Oscillospiraceae bacterium]|nr:GGDEF domain-containing protein [Oscillospiraceae bacterium]
MKSQNRTKNIAVVLFSVTLAAFFAFFLYMGAAERTTVYRADTPRGYEVVTGVQTELVSDGTAPIGLRKVYRWVLEPEEITGSSLLFTISHHEIQVYFDDALVYSLTGAEDNRIGRNVSSNWCSVYAGPERAGQTVTVVLTPMFDAALGKTPEFLFGAQDAMILDILTGELPLLVLCALSILVGLFMAGVSAYFRFILKTGNSGLAYLSLFSISLGLWKITDLKSASLLLPEASMAIGYISVGALFLCSVCLLMYFSTLFEKQKDGLILLLSCGASLVCLAVLFLQIFGLAEIRQNLSFSHILLVAAIFSIPLTALVNWIRDKKWGVLPSWRLLILLFAGIGVDLLLYYKNNDNGLLSFAILSFIVYTLIVFLKNVQESTRKAYIDSRTGLENRARWNELMHSDIPLPEPYAILVIDLNGLKQVNDTLGHDAGDRMIYALSAILRSTLPRSSVICRWGGDEFAAAIPGIGRAQLDEQIRNLLRAGEKYNAETPELPVHFALGAALSAEHPGISRAELFRLADEDMYRSKQLWYARKQDAQ